jgi:hypothetical protein
MTSHTDHGHGRLDSLVAHARDRVSPHLDLVAIAATARGVMATQTEVPALTTGPGIHKRYTIIQTIHHYTNDTQL